MKKRNTHILSCQHISKSFGNFIALSDITFSLHSGDKFGLVGANGTGKTTLLEILQGMVDSDSGTIEQAKGITIGYVPQTFDDVSSVNVLEFLGIDTLEVMSLLRILKLSESIFSRTVRELSGGEKTKVALAKVMYQKPDLILLDEPTNNLDFASLSLLENFVIESTCTFLIVSHDRAFLDKTVSKVIEIDEFKKTSALFDGNFTAYFESKRAMVEKSWAQYENSVGTQKKLKSSMKEKLDWMKRIEKERTSAKKLPRGEKEKPVAAYLRDQEGKMGRRARIIKERLEKFSQEQAIEKPPIPLPLHIEFEPAIRSGTNVFTIECVLREIGSKTIGPIDLSITYGERVLLVGENGVGKTTLLRMLLGQVPPDSGMVRIGTQVVLGYLPQEDFARSTETVRDEIVKYLPDANEADVRKILNRFKITADDISKQMRDLSSGERSRVLLGIMVSMKPNCIILDEPSNHLDFEALSELEEGLRDYTGTLIVVSHDRYFIERVGFDRVLVLDETIRESREYLE